MSKSMHGELEIQKSFSMCQCAPYFGCSVFSGRYRRGEICDAPGLCGGLWMSSEQLMVVKRR